MDNIYNKNKFLAAVQESFIKYKEYGARSTQKLKPLHKYIAELMQNIWSNSFEIKYLGDDNREATIEGKYYPKDIDITIMENNTPVFCVGIKFVTSNYKQNANNYFENMLGETANVQALGNLPYAQLIILRHETPYYDKDGDVSKTEIINNYDILKYMKLVFDIPQAHKPISICIPILDINEFTNKVTFTKLESKFSKEIIEILKTKLSFENFINDIISYKNYYSVKKWQV